MPVMHVLAHNSAVVLAWCDVIRTHTKQPLAKATDAMAAFTATQVPACVQARPWHATVRRRELRSALLVCRASALHLSHHPPRCAPGSRRVPPLRGGRACQRRSGDWPPCVRGRCVRW